MLLVALDRRGLELLFLASFDPERASLLNGGRYAAWCMQTSGNVVTGFHKPRFGLALACELLLTANPSAIGVGREPSDEAGRSVALLDGGHVRAAPVE